MASEEQPDAARRFLDRAFGFFQTPTDEKPRRARDVTWDGGAGRARWKGPNGTAFVRFVDDEGNFFLKDAADGFRFAETHKSVVDAAAGAGFRRRASLLRSALDGLREPWERGRVEFAIRRDREFADGFSALKTHDAPRWRQPFFVSYSDEAGLDAGGLSREFFRKASEDLLDPNFGVFRMADNATSLSRRRNRRTIRTAETVPRLLPLGWSASTAAATPPRKIYVRGRGGAATPPSGVAATAVTRTRPLARAIRDPSRRSSFGADSCGDAAATPIRRRRDAKTTPPRRRRPHSNAREARRARDLERRERNSKRRGPSGLMLAPLEHERRLRSNVVRASTNKRDLIAGTIPTTTPSSETL